MEAYDYSNSYSSSSSKSTIQSLHSVRKSSKKAPVAPPPPQPVKVYKVDPINFRDLVQQLTGAPGELKPQSQSQNTIMLSSGRDIAASTVPTNWFMGAHLNQ